ncbi:hypothetical protein FA95DRAFT_694070 [Auriscalpium vulgare]|uniref:Uncharacterized protein n=1 Tax=Auriscalpium vulgare TaxID=40419 RepID=A0ACB8RBN0_9AGAM|nr:hypothetical protein FA95DRAFT_694070 [Auriscalpium vulgare]
MVTMEEREAKAPLSEIELKSVAIVKAASSRCRFSSLASNWYRARTWPPHIVSCMQRPAKSSRCSEASARNDVSPVDFILKETVHNFLLSLNVANENDCPSQSATQEKNQ